MKKFLFTLIVSAACAASFAADKKPLTNADVVKMVRAELPESTIVIAIQNSPTAFDSAPESLIDLKTSGVGTKVIEEMLAPRGRSLQAPAAPVSQAAPAPAPALAAAPAPVMPGGFASLWGTKQTRIEADRVFLLEGGKTIELKFTKPNTRTRMLYARQTFAVLAGTSSRTRTSERTPAFEMIFPNNVEPTSVVALAMLGVRGNGTREILISSGWISMTDGLPGDRNIKLTYEKKADQSAAPEGYEIYQVRPEQPLKPGEYAFMVSKPSAGDFGGMAGASASFYFYELGVN